MLFLNRELLKPCLHVNSLNEIKLIDFWKEGKRGIILDLDNTITPWNQDIVAKPAHTFIEDALQIGFQICILSNATRRRTEKVASFYKIPFFAPALKPRKSAFLNAVDHINLKVDEVVVIGDQIFTDVLGGNRAGCYTILVSPLNKQEFLGTKIMRFVEQLIGK